MCTAITYHTKDFYFGKTLDYDHSYSEEVTIPPEFSSFLSGNGHPGEPLCHDRDGGGLPFVL